MELVLSEDMSFILISGGVLENHYKNAFFFLIQWFLLRSKRNRVNIEAHDLIYIKEVIFGGGIPMGLTTFFVGNKLGRLAVMLLV